MWQQVKAQTCHGCPMTRIYLVSATLYLPPDRMRAPNGACGERTVSSHLLCFQALRWWLLACVHYGRAPQREEDPITVFMGVPTMYSYLLNAYDAMAPEQQAAARAAAGRLRLTVSGSAACPLPVMQRWEELSGLDPLEKGKQTLLARSACSNCL